MNEEKEIAILRMDKLLAGITNKLRNTIEKCGARNSPLIQEIINLMELSKDFITTRMKKSPEVEHINLCDHQTKIAEISSELEVLQRMSDEQTSNSEILLRDTIARINDNEELMRNIQQASKAEILNEIEASMSKMLITREQGETRKKLLQSEIDSAEYKLDSIMEFNTATEKKVLDICRKVEQEYMDLLVKYDRDIGALYILMEKLSKNGDDIKAEKEVMERQLTVQRALYMQLKKEREIALMKVFTDKLELFRRNRAAKIIQKRWRVYLARIFLRRRRKTKKK